MKKESEGIGVEISKEEDNKLFFTLSGADIPFANMVRRYSMNSVGVYAMEEVTFYENTTNFFDEYLAHRIGLVPLITPEGAPADSEIVFYLEAVGPKMVYSGELISKDKEVKVAKDKIPIATLAENQAIRLEGKAKLGTSAKHAKFQPGLAGYEIVGDKCKFVLESFHQMPPRDMMLRGVESLEKDLAEIAKLLEKAGKKK